MTRPKAKAAQGNYTSSGTRATLRNSQEIQGNILAGFRKDHQLFIFIRFGHAESARVWLSRLLSDISVTRQVASFNELFSDARRTTGTDPSELRAVWTNVALTRTGFFRLIPRVDQDFKDFGFN